MDKESSDIKEIARLDELIFEKALSCEKITKKLEGKEDVIVNLYKDGEKNVAFKVGYKLDDKTFYSWIGGVDPNYRKQGIGKKLMELQHNELREKGYKRVQTKTQNQFKKMIILNLKCGFDIVEVKDGKILMEKEL